MESSEPSWGLPSEISPYCFIKLCFVLKKQIFYFTQLYKSLYQKTFYIVVYQFAFSTDYKTRIWEG